jgi:hypothetical protein
MGSVRFPELQISISFFWHQDHQGFPFDRVLVMFALNQNNNLCSAKNGESRHGINLILGHCAPQCVLSKCEKVF